MTASPESRSPVAIVGAGISGLAAAHRLTELGIPFVLLEASSRPGGVISTVREKGFLLEAGPDSFLARKPWAAELCRRIGLGDQIISTDSANRGSFILWRGRLHPLPEGLTSLVPTRLGPLARTRLLSSKGKARLLLEPVLPRRRERGDESLAGFFRRRLGEEASRRLVEPLVRGIYGGDAESLSLRATFPQLVDIERDHRSLILGLLREASVARSHANARSSEPEMSRTPRPSAGAGAADTAFLSLRDGMGSLVERIVVRLPAGVLRTRAHVTGLQRSDQGFDLRLEDGEPIRASAVVVATPPWEAAALLAPLDAELSSLVSGIRSGSSVTVALGFDRDRVRHSLRGHGFVVPESEGGPLLACTWASSKFPGRAPDGCVLLRAFLADAETILDRDDRAIVDLAVATLRPLLGIEGHPRLARVHRWRDALPRYAVGHLDRLAAIEARLTTIPGLRLAGSGHRGVGVPDCVRGGEVAVAGLRGDF